MRFHRDWVPMLVFCLQYTVMCQCQRMDESINDWEQTDPRLIRYIRENLLEPPPLIPDSISEMDTSSDVHGVQDLTSVLVGQYNQPPVIEALFSDDNATKRFFIEAGAYDGIMGSNTLRLELNENWSGLLVEPNPKLYQTVKSRNRNAWTLPSCFSMRTHPEIVTFDAADQIGGIVNEETGSKPGDGLTLEGAREEIRLQCVPLYSVLQALGNPRVDFFSLDIEGADLQVLRTIPFDLVDFSVIMIEVAHLGKLQKPIYENEFARKLFLFLQVRFLKETWTTCARF